MISASNKQTPDSTITKRPKNRAVARRGQTSVEYILIIAVVVGVIVAFGGQFKKKMESVTEQLFGGVSQGIGNLTGGK